MPQYERNPPLLESQLDADPLVQFSRWMTDAEGAGLVEPTAMTLSTVDGRGHPAARIVLFKGIYEGGFCFYTNYESRKGEELAACPYAALTFWWDKLERQVRIEGKVDKVSAAQSDLYFGRRPRGSQLGAVASRQSQPASSREALDRQLAEAEARCIGGPVPRPEHWGGYRVLPDLI